MPRPRSWLFALCLVLSACEDESSSGPADAALDEALCSEERDHFGLFCEPEAELIDSTRAVALLRAKYPGAQIYSMSGGGGGGTLNVDGEDYSWSFWFRDQGGTWLTAGVSANEGVYGEELHDLRCDGAPFEPLDSRRAVHEAVAAFDTQIRFFQHGNLFLRQDVCGFERLPEAHFVLMYPRYEDEDAAFTGDYYARFRRDGSFIDLVGPCAGTLLDECLAGVIVEPEE